jgi:hypothetical protein
MRRLNYRGLHASIRCDLLAQLCLRIYCYKTRVFEVLQRVLSVAVFLDSGDYFFSRAEYAGTKGKLVKPREKVEAYEHSKKMTTSR